MTRSLVLTLVAAAAVSACSGNNSPTAPTVAACTANHTATATFQNRDPFALDVVVDGAYVGTLGTGQSMTQTVSAGVQHPLFFRVTNTGLTTCPGLVNLADCASELYYCAVQ